MPNFVEYYFERYGDLELHRTMIGDDRRTQAFAEAISEVVKPGDVVLDIGTGTGVLAMLCAKAGAKRVYAVDQAAVAQSAANLVKANGLQDIVKVKRGAATDLELDEPVDLIVSEWLGNFAYVEGMWDDLAVVRDRYLKPQGRMLPSDIEILIAPIDDSTLYYGLGPGYWSKPVHGLDFSLLEEKELGQARASQIRVDPASLCAAPQILTKTDLKAVPINEHWFESEYTLKVERSAVVTGFAAWFRAQLSPNVLLDTAPHLPETHWAQTNLNWPPTMVEAGEEISIAIRARPDPDEHRHIRLDVEWNQVSFSYRLE